MNVNKQCLVIWSRLMKSPDELTQLFRSRGRKVTAQRQCIFRVLQDDVTHPTAESVFATARAEMETISLKTVYQTLNELAAMGEISALDLGTGTTRFDPNVEGVHHHLVCRSCGKVRDLHVDFSSVSVPSDLDEGFEVGEAEVVFRGLCRNAVTAVQRPGSAPRRCTPARRHRLTVRSSTDEGNTREKTRKEANVPELKGSKTESNLKEAFAGESQANRRYLYFAQKADVEGYPDVAALFRSVAEGETGHAFGHFDFLAKVGDPVTGVPVGPTADNLKSAIEGETYEYTEMYPGFARTARDEGFEEVAEWLEVLARAEKSHAGRFTEGLKSLLVTVVPVRPPAISHLVSGLGPARLRAGWPDVVRAMKHEGEPRDPVQPDVDPGGHLRTSAPMNATGTRFVPTSSNSSAVVGSPLDRSSPWCSRTATPCGSRCRRWHGPSTC